MIWFVRRVQFSQKSYSEASETGLRASRDIKRLLKSHIKLGKVFPLSSFLTKHPSEINTIITLKRHYTPIEKMLMFPGWALCSNSELSRDGVMSPWQSETLTGCHLRLPTARKCDIGAAVTLSQPATEGGMHPGKLREARL